MLLRHASCCGRGSTSWEIDLSLQSRLFFLVGTLLAAALIVALWITHRLGDELNDQVDDLALSVGNSVLQFVDANQAESSGDQIQVERIITDENGTTRILHEQIGDQITAFSVERGGEAVPTVSLPQRYASSWRDRIAVGTAAVNGTPSLRLSSGALLGQFPVPAKGIDAALEEYRRRLFISLIAVFVLALVVGGIFIHRMTRPLRELRRASQALGTGELGVQVAGTKARAGGSEIAAAVTAFNEMSTRLAALESERERMHRQQHLSEVGEIGRGLAHSLRNPLTSMSLQLQQIAESGLNGEQAGAVRDMQAQIKRVDHAIRGFLTLASAPQAEPVETDLVGLMQDVIFTLSQTSNTPFDLQSDGKVILRCVPSELRAVFEALCANAAEASPEEEAVEVSLMVSESGVLVTIADRGPGIPENIRKRLFKPHATTKSHGSGMGLYLSHRLVTTRYNGDVQVVAQAGGGTQVSLLLRDRT